VLPPIRRHRNHVGVTVETQTRGVGIGAGNATHERGATWRRVIALNFDAGALEIVRKHVGVPDFLAGRFGSVVDALITNQRLK